MASMTLRSLKVEHAFMDARLTGFGGWFALALTAARLGLHSTQQTPIRGLRWISIGTLLTLPNRRNFWGNTMKMARTIPLLVMMAVPISIPLAQADEADIGSVEQEAQRELEEIVVTGRRRAELLKDVPAQISVFTATDIEDAQIKTYQDFANLTPNFQTFDNFRKGVFNISVRGIPTVQGGEAPVTVLVDGVQVSGLDFINQDLFDLESIQVLRGPQGAIYGRGAIGGALLINTRRPGDEFEASVEGAFTSEIDEYRVTGSVSGPLAEDVAYFKLAASHSDRDGFIDNSLAGGQCDFVEETIVRGRLVVQPSDNLSIDTKANYLDGYTYATCLNPTTDADPFLGNGDNWPSDLPRDFKQFDDREIQDYSMKIDYEAAPGTLTSVTSYQKSDSYSPGDADFGPIIQPVFFENPVEVESWNTDLHFVSKPSDNMTWILGGFYQDRTTRNF